jgi:hypothetical protein
MPLLTCESQDPGDFAKGYRNINNYKMMIYLHLGGLNFE